MARSIRPITLAGLALVAVGFSPAVGWAQLGSLGSSSTRSATGTTGAAAGNSVSGSSLANSISSMNASRGMDAQTLRGMGGTAAFRAATGADLISGSQNNQMNQMMNMGMMSRMNGMGMFGNQFGMNQQQQNQRGKPQLRIPMRLGFVNAPAKMTARSTQFASRVPKIPTLKGVQGLSVEMAGETAILKGTVESEEQRDLLERMAKLEPGISAVQNELLVAASAESRTSSGSGEEVPLSQTP